VAPCAIRCALRFISCCQAARSPGRRPGGGRLSGIRGTVSRALASCSVNFSSGAEAPRRIFAVASQEPISWSCASMRVPCCRVRHAVLLGRPGGRGRPRLAQYRDEQRGERWHKDREHLDPERIGSARSDTESMHA
jgi:hypothetical protein